MRGEVISFYSYKGGVGRTMAVANLAVLLAQRGYRVLAVDFDLEAPGLHRYFKREGTQFGVDRWAPSRTQNGVIDMFEELRVGIKEDPRPTIPNMVRRLVDAGEYGHYIRVADPSLPARHKRLRFLSAGRFDKEYANRVRRFPWEQMYEEHPETFQDLVHAWQERFDYILIDSRTGLSDIGSVSTVILPQKLVLAFVPNEQSLDGVIEIGRQSVVRRREMNSARELALFPLISRVDETEEREKRNHLQGAARRFADLFKELYGRTDIDFHAYFDAIRIPHRGYYAYGEKIAMEEEEPTSMGSVAAGYDRFFAVLREHRLIWGLTQGASLRTQQVRRVAIVASFETSFDPPNMIFESILQIPEQLPEDTSKQLRAIPIQSDAWERLLVSIDEGLERATKIRSDELHVFALMPYAAAVYLGRKLDERLRARRLHIHQLDSTSHEWMPFSFPRQPGDGAKDAYFSELEVLSGIANGHSVLLVIEGMIRIEDAMLTSTALQYDIRKIIRLRPRSSLPLNTPEAAHSAMIAVRMALTQAQPEHSNGAIHVVATAPLALLIELGRHAVPTVYKSVVVHQFDAKNRCYVPVLDVISARVMNSS